MGGHPVQNIGRSHHSGKQPPTDQNFLAKDVDKGLYFQEQWDRLLKVDPEFAFVDGWNEWVAQRFIVAQGQDMDLLGKRLAKGDTFFVDTYNEEFSRDIQPMKGGYGDNYYMQLVANIRRFKGVRPPEKASPHRSIDISGSFHQWDAVRPEYLDTVGDVTHRDWPGWGSLHYNDTSGRNDIVASKVACDSKNIYFYVRTHTPLTHHTDPNWMQLLIDVDRDPSLGWHGYTFVVNAHILSASVTTLRRITDGHEWQIPYHVVGNEMQIAVPRGLIGQLDKNKTSFDFHWVDNVTVGGDIHDFWLRGDSAPNGRFNYRYESSR